jgi:ankyrin repeat protein
LYIACQEGHVDIIEFLLENGADVNKQGPKTLSPLHIAIYSKQLAACKLILEYEQVSNQNIESGITMSRIAQAPEIKALMEKALKKRRKVILVCILLRLIHFRALLILNSPKRSVASASRFLRSDTSVPDARSLYIVVWYVSLGV